MFKIENGNIYYIEKPMIDWILYGKEVIVVSTDTKYQVEIKKFNIDTEDFEHYDGLKEYEINGKVYDVINGFITVDPPEPLPEPEPSQLDRIESLLLEEKVEIQQEAIDNYTLELIESGAL